jgi:hypothetical protein
VLVGPITRRSCGSNPTPAILEKLIKYGHILKAMDAQEELYEYVESIRVSRNINLKNVAERLSKTFPHFGAATFGCGSDKFRRLKKEDSYGHAFFGEYLKILDLSPEEKEKIAGLVKKIYPHFGNSKTLGLDITGLSNRLKFIPQEELERIGKLINQSYTGMYNHILD